MKLSASLHSINAGRRGLTFTEVMISLFFLNLTLLLFLGIISLMVRGSHKLIDHSSGALVCGIIMEKYVYDAPFPHCGSSSGNVKSEGINFDYDIDVVDVVPHMRRVDVKVFWWPSPIEYKEGYGRLFTGMSTIVRENIQPGDE